jgi:hypothetical protein
MTSSKNIRRPAPGETPHAAGAYLYSNGPASESVLFLAVNFGATFAERADALQRALRSGWLIETRDGKISCSQAAREYYKEQAGEKEDEYIGHITPAQYRPSVFASQGLSKKNIPNSRGTRTDIPDWSIRKTLSFHTKA